MKKRAFAYAVFISFIGIALGIWSAIQYFSQWTPPYFSGYFISFFTLCVLFVTCRSLPLDINNDLTIDMSFICIFACMLLKGPVITAALILITTPLVLKTDEGKKGIHYLYIFNTSPIKVLFNVGNSIVSVLAGGFFYELAGGTPGNISLPGVFFPAIVCILAIILINGLILMLLFAFNSERFGLSSDLLKSCVGILPNIISAGSIGYFLAVVMNMPTGDYLALLLMLPLLLARYTFKLYLDSKKHFFSMTATLMAAIEAKDNYTEGHSRRVEQYAVKVGQAMGLTHKQLNDLRIAAVLHDIGKIGINDNILRKPGVLTPEERKVIETHPFIGVHILEGALFPNDVRDIILHHHERYDGRGYPDGTIGSQIRQEAYILSAADAFDAITSDRPYRPGRSIADCMEIMQAEAGKQFHPDVIRALMQVVLSESHEE